MRRPVEAVLGVICLGSLVVGALLIFEPSILPAVGRERVSALEGRLDQQYTVWLLAAILALFGCWRAYASGATDVTEPFEPDRQSPVGTTTHIVGDSTTGQVEEITEALHRQGTAETEPVRAALRASLLAVEQAHGYSTADAHERIRAGAWTDDRVAAAFLSDAPELTLPFWERLRSWLFPGRTFERRLERTLGELEVYGGVADD